MSKALKKKLFSIYSLCMQASKLSNYIISYDFAGTINSYSIFAYNKQTDEQIPIAVCKSITFKNLKDSKRKIIKLMEE